MPGVAQAAEPEPPTPSSVEFGRQYVRDLSGVTPATWHRYDRQVLLLALQLRAVLRAEPTRSGRLPAAAVGRHAGTVEDRMLLEVAVGTGLRWSELTALQVHDLDLDGPLPNLSVPACGPG